MKFVEITYNVVFSSGVFVTKLAERSFCLRMLSGSFLHALLGKNVSRLLYMMETLILCTLAFYRVGCALSCVTGKSFDTVEETGHKYNYIKTADFLKRVFSDNRI